MLTRIENLVPRPFDASSDESIETILARCYQIARERAHAIRIQLVETRARDEGEANGSNDDDDEK